MCNLLLFLEGGLFGGSFFGCGFGCSCLFGGWFLGRSGFFGSGSGLCGFRLGSRLYTGGFGGFRRLGLLAGGFVLVHDALLCGLIDVALDFAERFAGLFVFAGKSSSERLHGSLQAALGFAVADGSLTRDFHTLLG